MKWRHLQTGRIKQVECSEPKEIEDETKGLLYGLKLESASSVTRL